LTFQNLVKFGRFKPTVGHREPAVLVVVAPGAFGLLLTLSGAGAVMIVLRHSDILRQTY
jgi:hypothetical protein